MKLRFPFRRSLSFKIMAVLCGFLAGLIGVIFVMGRLTASSVVDYRLQHRGTTLATTVSCAITSIYDGRRELDSATRMKLQNLAAKVSYDPTITSVVIADKQGGVIAKLGPPELAASLTNIQIREAIEQHRTLIYDTADRRQFTIVTPLAGESATGDGNPAPPYGVACLTFDFNDVTNALRTGTERRALLALVSGVTICLAISYLLLRLVLRPARDLAQQAARLGRGDLSARSGLGRADPEGDEIQRLQHAFDRMAQRIERTQDERSAVMAALSESQRLFEEFMNNSPAVAFMKSDDGRYVYANARFVRAFGVSAQDLIGKTDEQVWPIEMAQKITENDRRVLRTNETMEFVEALPHSDGPHEWFTFKFPFVSPGGRMLAGIGIDITAHRRAEAMLQLSEQRFRALIENGSDIIAVMDPDGRIGYVSPSIERIAGYTPEDLTGQIGFDYVHREDRAAGYRTYRRMLQRPYGVGRFELRHRHRDGTWRNFEVIAQNLINDPSVNGIVINSRDITERKAQEEERRKLEARIQHAQKLESLGVLAGGIAHDFNNLLMGVLGNAGLALTDLDPASSAYGSVKHVETAALRAADLTRQMLAYSGKGKFTVQAVNLSRIVEEMVHLLRAAISKSASLRFAFDAALPPVEGDPTQIRQVAMNLITNASDAVGDHGGEITISTRVTTVPASELAAVAGESHLPEGEYVVLEVRDTGIGMSEQTLRRIYEPFFTTKFTGRGLGLAAVQGIMRAHRGAIRVSSAPGEGSTFQVLFPRSYQPVAVLAETRDNDEWTTWRGEGFVLVIDDEAVVRTMVRSVLERCGLTVLLAHDGREGLAIYREHRQRISVVLLDMTMPYMNGEEVYRELRTVDPGARVILSSGYSEQDAFERFTDSALADFIQKPYKPGALIEKVRAALHRTSECGRAK
ncbi:MAG: PAS domain S-box protein [Candidatus Hydrogenedentes bacterium]|nr:PAS domain S-box protein [Candidatus Hydrogenedentota bacterium]